VVICGGWGEVCETWGECGVKGLCWRSESAGGR
jgi:hypothetical protein